MKTLRHQKILEIIHAESIDKQQDLLKKLLESGFEVTQATVSRDIRELGLIKTPNANGKCGYAQAKTYVRDNNGGTSVRFIKIFKESAVSVDYAGHIVLVKCYSGMANAACGLFDSLKWENVVGTLSGDDTFFILTRSEEAANNICLRLKEYLIYI